MTCAHYPKIASRSNKQYIVRHDTYLNGLIILHRTHDLHGLSRNECKFWRYDDLNPPSIDAFKLDSCFTVEANGHADYARDAVDVFAGVDHGGIHPGKGAVW